MRKLGRALTTQFHSRGNGVVKEVRIPEARNTGSTVIVNQNVCLGRGVYMNGMKRVGLMIDNSPS